MLKPTQIKNLIHKKGLSNTDKLLLLLAAAASPQRPRAIVRLGTTAGLRGIKTWNVSSLLKQSRGKAINTPEGWELTDDGREHVSKKFSVSLNASPRAKVVTGVRKHLPNIGSKKVRSFVEEAVNCLEDGYFRAAVVLSWVGAVAILQEHVVNHKLVEFNAEAARRPQPKGLMKKAIDLRNPLFHDGYLQRRFSSLSRQQQQGAI